MSRPVGSQVPHQAEVRRMSENTFRWSLNGFTTPPHSLPLTLQPLVSRCNSSRFPRSGNPRNCPGIPSLPTWQAAARCREVTLWRLSPMSHTDTAARTRGVGLANIFWSLPGMCYRRHVGSSPRQPVTISANPRIPRRTLRLPPRVPRGSERSACSRPL